MILENSAFCLRDALGYWWRKEGRILGLVSALVGLGLGGDAPLWLIPYGLRNCDLTDLLRCDRAFVALRSSGACPVEGANANEE